MKAEIRDRELQARILLYHRFGLGGKTTHIIDEELSIENLDFKTALHELKRSYKEFIESKESYDKITGLMLYTFASKHHRISERDSAILIQKISTFLQNFYTDNYYDSLVENLTNHQLVIVPVNTYYLKNGNGSDTASNIQPIEDLDKTTEHVKAIALFDERLLKVNPKGLYKGPSIRIYRIQPYSIPEMEKLLRSFLDSFETPLNHNMWDKSLNAMTDAEKIGLITKKEQNVGNGSWLTAKMMIIVTVYAIIYQYCQSKDIKEFEAEDTCSKIAEGIYKFFIVDDRNRAVKEYLALHGFHSPTFHEETLSVKHRLASIKNFLSTSLDRRSLPDKKMLDSIYIKSLNWLLADYLKKGDIGEAHALIEAEVNNHQWNPLIYAAKNGKAAIAELLGSNPRYITQKGANGDLPLHYAIQNKNEEIFKIFLRYKKKNKLNLLAKNQEGNTALHLAALNNELEIAEALLENQPDLLNIKNDNGETALKIACDNYNPNIINTLLSKGANLEGIGIEAYSEEIQTQLRRAGRPTLL